VKKLLAAVAVLAPLLVVLPASSANADSVCAPITVDGQPVCQDTTPINQLLADIQALEFSLIGNPDTAVQCTLGTTSPRTDEVVVDVVFGDPQGYVRCYGTEITVTPTAAVPMQTTHIHVPQVCATTTGTCVGPVDEDVSLPSTPSASLSICETPVTIYDDGFGWRRQYTGPSTCIATP